MAIDASIYSQIRQPEMPNVLAQALQAQQLGGAIQQNKLADLQMQEYARSRQQDETERGVYAGFGNDPSANLNALYKAGLGKQALSYQKAAAENAETAAKTEAQRVTSEAKKWDLRGQAFGYVKDNPSLENLTMAVQNLQGASLIDATQLDRLRTMVQQDPSPAGIQKVATMLYQGALSAKEQLPQFQTRNTGGTTDTLSVNPVTGKVAVANSVQNTQSPDNAASVAASRDNAQATRDAARTTAEGNKEAARIQTKFGNEQGLRKEFDSLAEVKNYKQALPAYQAVKDAALRNTPQADINLVYGIAKLYDPNSVVREGEYATVANSPNIPERVKGYAQYLAGGGKLSPETKRQILAEADGRLKSYQGEVEKARQTYSNIAGQAGIRPESVLQSMGDFQQGGTNAAPQPAKPGSDIDALLKKYGE